VPVAGSSSPNAKRFSESGFKKSPPAKVGFFVAPKEETVERKALFQHLGELLKTLLERGGERLKSIRK
jgi:hypothetical protein